MTNMTQSPPEWLILREESPIWKAALEGQNNPIRHLRYKGKKVYQWKKQRTQNLHLLEMTSLRQSKQNC